MDRDSHIDDVAEAESEDDLAFREQCRRQMNRSIETRMKYGFYRVHRPVLDEPGVRTFSSTKEYREWCAANLPEYLGFRPATEYDIDSGEKR